MHALSSSSLYWLLTDYATDGTSTGKSGYDQPEWTFVKQLTQHCAHICTATQVHSCFIFGFLQGHQSDPSRQLTAAMCRHRQLQLHYHQVEDEVLAAALAHLPCLQVAAVTCSCLWLRHLVLGAVNVAHRS